MEASEVRSRWGVVPRCEAGKNHRWDGDKVGECGVCIRCGYDAFDKCYKKLGEAKE